MQIDFSEPLDPTRAQDVANYRLNGLGRVSSSTQATYAHLSPNAQTVTVRFDRVVSLQAPHELTVVGMGPSGLTNTGGQYLDSIGQGNQGNNSTLTIPFPTTHRATGVRATAAALHGSVNPAGPHPLSSSTAPTGP